MGLMRRISSYFIKPKPPEEEIFLRNGSELQAELIGFSSRGYDILIRSFTAKELVKATRSFSERIFDNGMTAMFRGHLEGRQILVTNNWRGRRYVFHDKAIRDIVISSHMCYLKNVLKLVGCCLEFESPALVYEYVEGTLLSDYLLNPNSDNKLLLSWRSRIKIASDIASTILYLHTAFPTPVIYRDINPSNMIVDKYGVVKLFDFALCISLPPGELSVETEVRGTFGFADPEYIDSGIVTQKSDVYNFGIFLLILLTGKTAFWKDHEGKRVVLLKDDVKYYANNHQYDQLIDPRILEEEGGVGNENLLPSNFLDLALMCTRDSGDERPDMIDVTKQLRLMEKRIRNSLPSIN